MGNDDLETSVEEAERAFEQMDEASFHAHRDEVRSELACLREIVPPTLAGAVHRLEGLDAFLLRNWDQASLAFQASTAVDPEYRFPEHLAPEGNPLWSLYQEARAAPLSSHVTETPRRNTTLFVDGVETADRPRDRAAILQLLDDEGSVAWSHYQWDGSQTPPWPGPPRATLPLAVSSGVVTGAAGALFAVAWSHRAAFADPATPLGDLERHKRLANTYGIAAQAVGVAGLGLGVSAAVSTRF